MSSDRPTNSDKREYEKPAKPPPGAASSPERPPHDADETSPTAFDRHAERRRQKKERPTAYDSPDSSPGQDARMKFRRDPSVPAPSNSAYKHPIDPEHSEDPELPTRVKVCRFLYDKHNKTYCGRSCSSWGKIILYGIVYLIFLMTYFMIVLYFSLVLIKKTYFQTVPEDATLSLLTYSPDNIGITGIPLAEHNYPLIWYRSGEADDYYKYVTALDELFEKKREKRDLGSNLGPCGKPPYGYGDNPCVVVKINKQFKWSGKPLTQGSPKTKDAPEEVQKWVQRDSKKYYWLHCQGYHNYDKEHIQKIKYYPDPPGFDSSLFPLNEKTKSPLVALQITNFTLGISLAIDCKLWFENGISSVAFMLYVAPKNKNMRSMPRW